MARREREILEHTVHTIAEQAIASSTKCLEGLGISVARNE